MLGENCVTFYEILILKFPKHFWNAAFFLQGIAVYLDEVLEVNMPPNKHWYCCLQMYNYTSAFLCSAYLLISMTFERFYSIIRPHKAASFNTVKKARIIIVCIFIFYFTYSIPFLFIGGHNGISCVINRFASGNILGEMHHWLNEVFVFVFPFLSLLTMNSVIIHTLRKRSKLNYLASANHDESRKSTFKKQKSRETDSNYASSCNICISNSKLASQKSSVLC